MTQRRRLKIAPEVESAGAIFILRKHHHMTCLTDHRVLLLSANRCLFLAKFLSLSTSGSLIMPASGYKNRPRARTRAAETRPSDSGERKKKNDRLHIHYPLVEEKKKIFFRFVPFEKLAVAAIASLPGS